MKSLITVYSTMSLGEAEIIKGMLINHDIHCVVDNALFTLVIPSMNGIEVKVYEKDAEEAIRILRLNGYK